MAKQSTRSAPPSSSSGLGAELAEAVLLPLAQGR